MSARLLCYAQRARVRPLARRLATAATHGTSANLSLAPSAPLQGSLSAFPSRDETPSIGTRFPSSVQLSSLLSGPRAESDTLIRDLATLVSHRGVVFFENQDITLQQQKELGYRMGKLSGNPSSSGLHRHPISEDTGELGGDTSVISSMGYVPSLWAADTRLIYVSAALHGEDSRSINAPVAAGIATSHSSPYPLTTLCLRCTHYQLVRIFFGCSPSIILTSYACVAVGGDTLVYLACLVFLRVLN